MSDDLLDRATQALRATSSEPNLRSGLTRARLLDSAERQSRTRRARGLRWALACAGLLVAGSALARVADQLPALWQAIVQPSSGAHERPQPAPARKPRLPARATEPGRTAPPIAAAQPQPSEPIAQPHEPIAQAPKAPRPRAPQREPRRPRATAVAELPAATPVPTPAQSPQPRPESAELALFRRAQRLHLARDPEALAAWDAYLRVAGHGALAPEARYNRALCLLRLGRKSEARAALAPFANGELGAYRRSEAQQLLEALEP